MDPVLLLLCLVATIFPMCRSSPRASNVRRKPNSNLCKLPGPVLNQTGPGEYRFLEDCSNIAMFATLPMPLLNLPVPAPNQDLGVHPYVCCPNNNAGILCIETDPLCSSYKETLNQITDTKVSENICPNRSGGDGSAQCVNFKDCEGILNQGGDSVAHVDVCGWDEGDKALKICCPTGSAQGRKNYKPYPRYSEEPEMPYECTNKADLVYGADSVYEDAGQTICEIWKDNGGCDTDKHFQLDPNSTESIVTSWEMFHFMTMSCMESCGRCRNSTCQDQHPKCRSWARNNMCVTNPRFMGHTCRESCGVCGFLSPFDETVQNIEGNIYTYKQDAFTDEGHRCPVGERKNFPIGEIKHCFDCGRENVDVEASSSCEVIIFSDKWAATSVACHPTHQNIQTIHSKSNRTIRIRQQKSYLGVSSEEILEMKKVYKNPTIAGTLVELGRRIPFDFQKYGDTPTCPYKGENTPNRWIKCIMESSYEFKNNHDKVQEHCKGN